MDFSISELIQGQSPLVLIGIALAAVLLLYNMARTRGQAPKCPKCNKLMVTRVASKGRHEGKPFWGCPDHNKTGCTGLRKK